MPRYRIAVQTSGVVVVDAASPEAAVAAVQRESVRVGTATVLDRETDAALLGVAQETHLQPVDVVQYVSLNIG